MDNYGISCKNFLIVRKAHTFIVNCQLSIVNF